MLIYCQLDTWEQVSVKFKSELCHFYSRKCIPKCHLPKWQPFFFRGDELIHCYALYQMWWTTPLSEPLRGGWWAQEASNVMHHFPGWCIPHEWYKQWKIWFTETLKTSLLSTEGLNCAYLFLLVQSIHVFMKTQGCSGLTHSTLNKTADIFQTTFSNAFSWVKLQILIKISHKSVPKGPIDNRSALVQVMAWCVCNKQFFF